VDVATLSLFFLLAAPPPATPNPCSASLPKSLTEELRARFPESKLLTFGALTKREKRLFQQKNPGKCPGVTALDFYGEGHDAYAIVLREPHKPEPNPTFIGSHEAVLFLARPEPERRWSIQLVERANSPTAIVVSLPPADYESVYGDAVIHAKNPVIGFGDSESFFIVFSWNGSRIEKVWLSD
jgi:hypothetical protein